jgi:hypothetical protein
MLGLKVEQQSYSAQRTIEDNAQYAQMSGQDLVPHNHVEVREQPMSVHPTFAERMR